MKIYKKGAKCLTRIAEPVDITKLGTIVMLMGQMFNEMYQANGVGLAAPQVGKNIQMLVIDCSKDEITPYKGTMINPKITYEEGSQDSLEGCLSVPGQWYKINRPNKITVEFVNILGDNKIEHLEGATAAVVYHEIDHLSGILICQIGEEVPAPDGF